MQPVERGFLVLADISGFTAFVTTTELEHGAEVTGVLLGEVMKALSPPLEIQELEGDAVFALAPEGRGGADAPLLATLGRAFQAFKHRQRALAQDDSCECGACRGTAGLDLKLIVHYGSFLRQAVGGRPRVAGPDVVLAHQLLKNRIAGRAYALLTDPAADRLGIDPLLAGLDRETEQLPHFGEVGYVTVPLGADAADLASLSAAA
ncbi:MAG: DUF2652 domain-containing protein [Candidatus Rokubacteria bacterium]|nr:DUF2652 domain-containing protein [Candidatus Rokubacteria bacterium]